MTSTPADKPYRARYRLAEFDYADPDAVFFVTIRACPGTAPFTNPVLARIVSSSLQWLRTERHVTIYAYCLMPDHLHLLLRLPSGSPRLGQVIRTVKDFTTKASRQHGWSGLLWQGDFYDHVLRRSEAAWTIAEYIRQNPVRKGLVAEPEEWPYLGLPDPME